MSLYQEDSNKIEINPKSSSNASVASPIQQGHGQTDRKQQRIPSVLSAPLFYDDSESRGVVAAGNAMPTVNHPAKEIFRRRFSGVSSHFRHRAVEAEFHSQVLADRSQRFRHPREAAHGVVNPVAQLDRLRRGTHRFVHVRTANKRGFSVRVRLSLSSRVSVVQDVCLLATMRYVVW